MQHQSKSGLSPDSAVCTPFHITLRVSGRSSVLILPFLYFIQATSLVWFVKWTWRIAATSLKANVSYSAAMMEMERHGISVRKASTGFLLLTTGRYGLRQAPRTSRGGGILVPVRQG